MPTLMVGEEFMKNKVYPNEELIRKADEIAEKICAEQRSNHHRDRFFPKMIDALELKLGVEIGTDKGGFAERVLSNSSLQALHCVDPWIDDFGSDYRPGFFAKDGNIRMNEARETLGKFMDQGRCFLHKGFSAEIASRWDKKIDFLYVDGDHSLEGIYTDLYSWIEHVGVGGIIAGHDYKDGPKSGMKDFFGEQLPFKVKTVVDNFCQQYGFKLNVTGGRILSWWFVKV